MIAPASLESSKLIFYPRLVDLMWYFADAAHMNRRKLKENCHKLPLATFSGFWSLITLLFLSTVPAYAEWVAVEKDYLLPGLQTVYVDPDTIRREGNLVALWQLIDFKTMQGGEEPLPIFVDEDSQGIRLCGKASSVACVHGVLTPYGNRYSF